MMTVSPDKLVTLTAKSRNKSLAIEFLKRCDKFRYGILVVNLDNYSVGTDQYPTDLPSALSAIESYVRADTMRSNRQHHTYTCTNEYEEQDVEKIFIQATELVPGIDGVTHAVITCFRYNGSGCYRSQYPAQDGF